MVILENIIRRSLEEQMNHPMKLIGDTKVSDNLKYHLDNSITLTENVFRVYSPSYFDLINEARDLQDSLDLSEGDREILATDIGKFGIYEGEEVPLDFPFLAEAQYHGKEVELGKPKRGGHKKYSCM